MPEFREPEKQKRTDGRLRMNMAANYRLKGKQDWKPCKVLDLSSGGLLMEGSESFYIDDVIEIQLQLEAMLTARLRVTNLSGKKAGCQFLDLTEVQQDQLRNYVHANLGL
ncbi:MAG: PilZ domain-containing protein [Leptospiraceae bacterium]|nr:PilZ domain-containing protein [Leptospiraceae bacterium]MCB1199190.1 PilZ domain-containing protein [Leptospiraceae bacterium]